MKATRKGTRKGTSKGTPEKGGSLGLGAPRLFGTLLGYMSLRLQFRAVFAHGFRVYRA